MSEIFVIVPLYAAGYLVLLMGTRSILRRMLARRMAERAAVARTHSGASTSTSTSTSGQASASASGSAPGGVPPVEQPSERALSLRIINAAWSSDDGDTHKRWTAQARGLLRRTVVLDMVLLAALVAVFSLDTGELSEWSYPLMPVMLVVFARYALHHRQYRVGGSPRWRPGLLGGLGALPFILVPLTLLHRLSTPALQAPLRWVLLVSLAALGIAQLQDGQAWGWASIAVVLAVSLAEVLTWLRLADPRGHMLLMLRVFHKDVQGSHSGVATFGSVLDRWLNFGPFFTVMDADLLRFRSPILSGRTALVFIGLFFYIAGFVDNREEILPVDHALAASALVIVWLIDSWLAYRRGLVTLVADESDIPAVLAAGARSRDLGLRFRSVEVTCTDATWYPTVVAIARQAEVVLMDLRGYTPERAGCETEVNLLFDTIELRRIIFMIEPGKLAQIQAMFARCWRDLAVDSPNLALPDPEVSVVEYPLGIELASERLTERQVLLEELALRATGAPQGRLEHAKRSVRLPTTDTASTATTLTTVTTESSQGLHGGHTEAAPVGLSPSARRAVRRVINRFEGTTGILVGARIPARKLRNARQHVGVPSHETVLALIDQSIFGSGKEGLVFTDTALRYWTMSRRGVVDYMYLPQRRIEKFDFSHIEILAPDGMSTRVNTFQGNASQWDVLQLLKALATAVGQRPIEFDVQGRPCGESTGAEELAPESTLAIREVLLAAKALRSYHVGNDIPEKKALNARAACHVPPEETLIALIDLTVFGSAENCWTFTNRALRYHGASYDQRTYEYHRFPTLNFSPKGSGTVLVRTDEGHAAELGCYTPEPKDCVALLDAISAAVKGKRIGVDAAGELAVVA